MPAESVVVPVGNEDEPLGIAVESTCVELSSPSVADDASYGTTEAVDVSITIGEPITEVGSLEPYTFSEEGTEL